MYYYPDWNLTYFSPPGCSSKHLEEWLDKQAKKTNQEKRVIVTTRYDWYSITTQSIFVRIDNSRKVILIRHPLHRLYSIYQNFDNYIKKHSELKNIPHQNFSQFISFLFHNKDSLIEEGQSRNELTLFYPQLWMISKRDNYVNFNQVIKDNPSKKDITELVKSDMNISENDTNELFTTIDNELPEDYMVHYTEEMIKMVYVIHYPDFNHFEFPLHKVPISFVKYPIKDRTPIFTIITPTVGTPSIWRLKKALQYESIPFIHLILWDNARDKNAVNPKELEDERTFCYEFKHPYHRFPKQRNDVWLRAVGITLTNTPYVTFFDDDTWPDRNHLEHIINYMSQNKLDYTYCKRRMWSKVGSKSNSNLELPNNNLELLGVDDFEAIGEMTKMGYRLIDNSSLYMRIDTARKVETVFLANQVYGDDRITPDFLDNNAKGDRMHRVFVNHVAKDHLVPFFRQGVTPEIL